MTITAADLSAIRQALVGCSLTLKFIQPASGFENARKFEILEVAEPPREPEIKEHWKPIYCGKDGEPYSVIRWYLTWEEALKDCGNPTENDPLIGWYRRETIDGIAQTPTLVSAKP